MTPEVRATPGAIGKPLITRPRLIQCVGADVKTVVIFAPAGYGKTVLLHQLARGSSACWLNAATAGSDIRRFSCQFANAIRGLNPVAADDLLRTVQSERNDEVLVDLMAGSILGLADPKCVSHARYR